MNIPKNAKCVFKWKIFDVYQREQILFNNEKKIFEKIKRNDTINVIPILSSWEIIVLEEEHPWRNLFYSTVWWMCEDWENPIETGKRELLEETWLYSNDWKLFWKFKRSSKIDYTSNIFIAKNCKKIKEQNLDPWGERILVKKVNWNEFLNFIIHPKFSNNELALEILKSIYLWKEKELKKKILWN